MAVEKIGFKRVTIPEYPEKYNCLRIFVNSEELSTNEISRRLRGRGPGNNSLLAKSGSPDAFRAQTRFFPASPSSA